VEGTSQAAVGLKDKSLKDGSSDYIGLDTMMMQDATDYLGARQREDFIRWKAGIMLRIQEIETSGV
jgi:origin recognition complex subunit 6